MSPFTSLHFTVTHLARVILVSALASLSCVAQAANDETSSIEQARAILASPLSTAEESGEAKATLQHLIANATDPTTKGSATLALASATLLADQKLKASIPLYESARKFLPHGSREWIEATLGLATATQHRLPISSGSIQRAEELYKEILAVDQTSPIAARAIMSIGRIYEVPDYNGDKQDQEQARVHYTKILEQWPNEEITHEAALRIGSTYIQESYYPPTDRLNDWTWRTNRTLKGIHFLENWAQAHPGAAMIPGIWEYVGNCYLMLPQEDKWRVLALHAYLESTGDGGLLKTGTPNPIKTNLDRVNPGYLYLRIAALAQQQGLREVAFEYYTRLISEVPDYIRGPEAALQLTANLSYSQAEVIERVRWQYQSFNYSETEIELLLENFEFLASPVGIPVPRP